MKGKNQNVEYLNTTARVMEIKGRHTICAGSGIPVGGGGGTDGEDGGIP